MTREIIVRGSSRCGLVDDDDYDRVSVNSWRLQVNASGNEYAVHDVRRNGKVEKDLLHRVVLLAPVGSLVDHKNRDGLDNRRDNLRIATVSQNLGNRISTPNRTSKYKGVSWDSSRGKWRVSLRCNKINYELGRFDSEEVAAKAYDAKAVIVWGEFALLNFRA